MHFCKFIKISGGFAVIKWQDCSIYIYICHILYDLDLLKNNMLVLFLFYPYSVFIWHSYDFMELYLPLLKCPVKPDGIILVQYWFIEE